MAVFYNSSKVLAVIKCMILECRHYLSTKISTRNFGFLIMPTSNSIHKTKFTEKAFSALPELSFFNTLSKIKKYSFVLTEELSFGFSVLIVTEVTFFYLTFFYLK